MAIALSGALSSGTLSAGQREQLAIATAEANGCGYCLSAHTYLGGAVGELPEDELEFARDAKSSDPHTDALLTLSEEILSTHGHGAANGDTLAEARAAGVTDEAVGEVVGHIALNVLNNYLNIMAGTEIDWPVTVNPRH